MVVSVSVAVAAAHYYFATAIGGLEASVCCHSGVEQKEGLEQKEELVAVAVAVAGPASEATT